MKYTAIVEFDPKHPEEGYSAYVPALPGCISSGATLEEIQTNLEEAISLYLEELTERGEALPADEPIEVRVLEVAV